MTDTPVDVTTLTPAEAGAKLAELEAAYRPPPPSATPTTPQEAQGRLNHLTTDRNFAERFARGDAEAVREFKNLTEQIADGDQPLDFTMETIDAVSDPHAMPRADYHALLEALRDGGAADSAIAYVKDLDSGARGDRPTAGDGAAAQAALDRLMRDAEFRKGVLAGEIEANRLRVALSNVIALADYSDGKPTTEIVLKYLGELGLR